MRYLQLEAVRLLLGANASADARARSGDAPLHTLVFHAHQAAPPHAAAIATELLSHGASVDAATPTEGFTPLYVAVYMSAAFPAAWHAPLLETLLAAGARPDAANALGGTPRQVAAYFGLAETGARLEAAAVRRRRRALEEAVEETAAEAAVEEACRSHAVQGQERRAAASLAGDAPPAASLEELSVHLGRAKSGPKAEGEAVEAAVAGDDDDDDERVEEEAERAAAIWRRQGVVVFPALLPAAVVDALRARVAVLRRGGEVVDRSASLRNASGGRARELRGVPLADSGGVLAALGVALAPFLRRALRHRTQLLLESSVMVTRPGAADQEWHTDLPNHDDRIASVQVALTDVEEAGGPLEVQPGTHLDDEPQRGRAAGAAAVRVAVPRGSVTVYAPRLRHRGCGNAAAEERITLAFTLVGSGGLLPPGLPYTVEPADAWQWAFCDGQLERGEVRRGGGGEPALATRDQPEERGLLISAVCVAR